MDDIAIKIENLSKVYRLYDKPIDRLKESINPLRTKYHKDFYALRDISFEVKTGETIGIIGKNGSGKSTLLKIITGILTPSSGSVAVNGKVSALLELGAGFNPEYTGIENIYLNGTILGFSKDEISKKLNSILEFADIGEFIYQQVKTYSSGMFVRLAFAVAINIEPDILIVDEALSVGDALFQKKCFSKIRDFMEKGKTVLFVTHDLRTILELCNRVLIFDSGEKLIDTSAKIAVNLYNRLLFALTKDIPDIRQYIKNTSKEMYVETKDDINLNYLVGKKFDPKSAIDKSKQKALFSESLIPQSTIEYKNYNVEIFDEKITTLEGEKVNLLVFNDSYIYSYKTRFNMDANKVSFGMMFTNTKGVRISGKRTPGFNNYIEYIKCGELYEIRWQFQCKILPDFYYATMGIYGFIGDNEEVLNRKVDAIAFQVQHFPANDFSALVSLDQFAVIEKLQEEV